ncbi:hypothetical protein KZC51_16035 [Microbacterium sp. SSW1-49]|uniref:Uncharacterized protein n=2 Tax=Microbacterium croceum TaxID=2851645 RepID=A0ABT0FIA2_9MICO|nr:daptide biosynthesis RiPP recognition protein [Microbacterium croceum]MCK2037639.1 hypothetical protein [Microbacterium croceum]
MQASSIDAATQGEAFAERVGARALREWIIGEPQTYTRVFLVESGANAAPIDEVAVEGDVVLLPDGSEPIRGAATAVHYSGALTEIGDELFLGDRGVELQDYVAAEFVQIIGPTAVCFPDAASWQAFLDDARLARRTGVFPSALLDPRVILAHRGALANPQRIATPSAIRVRADGRVSVGVRGEVIGSIDDLRSAITAPLPQIAAWAGAASITTIAADLADRDGVGRYLHATDLMKMLRLANGSARIGGFGWSPLDDGRADAEPLPADPFLLETPDGVVLADVTTLRRQLLSPLTATVVAAVQTSRSHEVATERVARRLGMTASAAGALCRDAVSALSIHVGRAAARESRTTGIAE